MKTTLKTVCAYFAGTLTLCSLAAMTIALHQIACNQVLIIRAVDGTGCKVEINNCDMHFVESTNSKPTGIYFTDGRDPDPPPPMTNVTFEPAFIYSTGKRPHFLTPQELDQWYARQTIPPDRRVYRSPRDRDRHQ